MLAEDNARLTQVGVGTPAGELLRRYWQPVATEAEWARAEPFPVTMFGEEWVVFRDEAGEPGCLGLHCSHRGTDLSYGRVEDGGLRCLYHGWLYDRDGRCLEQPGEPPGSRFAEKILHPAAPCRVEGGLVWAYFGPGNPPPFPQYEYFAYPASHRFVGKMLLDCNWWQVVEGNLDPAHLSFLHRRFRPRDERPVPGSTASADVLYGADAAPRIETRLVDSGLRIYAMRRLSDGRYYLRTTHFLFPNAGVAVGNEGRVGQGYSLNWYVPATDTVTWRFEVTFNRERPVDTERFAAEWAAEVDEHDRLRRSRHNRYLQDRQMMKTANFSGIGEFFPAQDAMAQETQGPVADRTREHLATTDRAIIAARHLVLQELDRLAQGLPPLNHTRQDFRDIRILSRVVEDPEAAMAEIQAQSLPTQADTRVTP